MRSALVISSACRGSRRLPREPKLSTDPIINAYMAYARQHGLSENTLYHRELSLARTSMLLGGPLTEATPERLRAWRRDLLVSNHAVLNYVTDLRRFYSWALGEGLVAGDPTRGLPLPRKEHRLPRPISDRDLFGAVAGAPPRVRPWIVLAAWSGLRAVEIAGLRRANVLDAAPVPALLIARDATKGRRERIVPMAPLVLAELHAAGLPATGWVFTRRDGRPGPNRAHMVSRLVNQLFAQMGIGATLHQCRHWFGTQAYRQSRDIRLVQELMGHRDPATTALYAAHDQAAAAGVVGALPVPGAAR